MQPVFFSLLEVVAQITEAYPVPVGVKPFGKDDRRSHDDCCNEEPDDHSHVGR